MSPRIKFWLLLIVAWTLIGLSFPLPGVRGAACDLAGIALAWCALRVVHSGGRR